MSRMLWVLSVALLVPVEGFASAIVFNVAGPDAASIQTTVDTFRLALGGALNPNVPGSFGAGRREINWDGVPDVFAAPNLLPTDFYNVNSPRGVEFSTPGTGFQVSARAASGTAVQFGNIDPTYPLFFEPFTPERLFTALGSTVTDVNFFVPGTDTPAYTSGFGVVFSDVDVANTTSLQFFDVLGNPLGGPYFADPSGSNEGFSFLGVVFNAGEQVGRVRIVSGNQILSPGNTLSDLVVMDDFIYGEPIAAATAVPEPATGLLICAGLGLAGWYRRRTY